MREYWELRLKREGLGIHRGAPNKHTRFFFPGEEINLYQRPRNRGDYQIAWDRLTKREEEVIWRMFFDLQSEREVALAMRISRSSVRVYRRRALRKLGEKGGIIEARDCAHPPGENGDHTRDSGNAYPGIP